MLLEGFHAVKHALRFGAELIAIAAADRAAACRLARALAPDVAERLDAVAVERPLAPLVDPVPRTGVAAVARRPAFACPPATAAAAPVVLLDDPRHLGNVGAVVRVAAAAGAAAVLTTGAADPWFPPRCAARPACTSRYRRPRRPAAAGARPLVAVVPGGPPLGGVALPASLRLRSERRRSARLLERAHARVGIPMRPCVSSLNLATAVVVVLLTPERRRFPRPSASTPRVGHCGGPCASR